MRSRSVKVKTIDRATEEVIRDLLDTYLDVKAYGISAPQIGILKRIILFRGADDEPVIVVNPKIIRARGEIRDYDGCLSIPGISAKTRRAAEIELSGLTPDGSRYRRHLEDFTARIAQHELDHLDGVLFIDRLDDLADLYTVETVENEDGEPETREVSLDEEEVHFVERERRPVPGFALPVG